MLFNHAYTVKTVLLWRMVNIIFTSLRRTFKMSGYYFQIPNVRSCLPNLNKIKYKFCDKIAYLLFSVFGFFGNSKSLIMYIKETQTYTEQNLFIY